MSSLLKKDRDSEVITVFGFPSIDSPGDKPAEAALSPEPEPEPEPDLEEIYRKKLLELERSAQEIEKEAYAKGFAQGEKDGFEYGHKGVQVVKTQLERIAENLDSLPEQVFGKYREWLIETSFKLARHIVKQELQMNPRIIEETVAALIEEAGEETGMTVYLNPGDYEFLEKRANLSLTEGSKRLTIKPDSSLERGGCFLESDVKLLDASIETQFENLRKLLLGTPESEMPDDADVE
ncbi:MAG: hypothetical protein LLG06_05815 [Desulfobacteraceae bacterium]|nr:hypothetical protein [Desulfobacteraceae bacterium]